jgi:hypothetical protein
MKLISNEITNVLVSQLIFFHLKHRTKMEIKYKILDLERKKIRSQNKEYF